jgi:hypothetical protein
MPDCESNRGARPPPAIDADGGENIKEKPQAALQTLRKRAASNRAGLNQRTNNQISRT